MTLQDAFKKIENYLRSDKRVPYIVNVQNRADLVALKEQFCVGRNEFWKASKYCNPDENLRLEELQHALSESEGIVFLTEISTFLKLESELDLKKELKSFLFRTVAGKLIIVTYQCDKQLQFSDPRINTQVMLVDGNTDEIPQIKFVTKNLPRSIFVNTYEGIENLAVAIESSDTEEVSIYTKMSRGNYPLTMYSIRDLSCYYDILVNRDLATRQLLERFGTQEQWCYVLLLMGQDKTWANIIDGAFGNTTNLAYAINSYTQFDDNKKWLYYIGLKLYGVRDNAYLKKVTSESASPEDFVALLFRAILQFDVKAKNFDAVYNERKTIIANFKDYVDEITEYCKVVETKGKDAIFYLTDLTQPEKEKIFMLIDRYAYDFQREGLLEILGKVYPDLYSYLLPYRFRNETLEKYFQDYKYQKVINRIYPEFLENVEKHAVARDFITLLRTRTSYVEQIDTIGSELYFMDAMGVEYLSFIVEKCKKYGLSSNILFFQAELPTLTCCNKEFVDYFKSKGCKINKIKYLDEIKHHGTDSSDYEVTKLPFYMIKELEIIDEVLSMIKAKLSNNTCKKVVMISDHGASRLAVINESENRWEMATKGEHSGRCCPTTDFNDRPDVATEERNFWVLANYDRFKGGRKANVEVHGGATLEEVTVPIIELTIRRGSVEAFVVDSFKKIKVGRRKNAAIALYVGEKRQDIYIQLNGKPYDAIPTTNDYVYSVDMPDIIKKGTYTFDVYAGSELIVSGLSFEAQSMLGGENQML